jgi:hypothetical protein
MKKMISVIALAVMSTFVGAANCNGSSVVSCTSDADCTDAATPACIETICQADLTECENDVDCRLADPDSPTTSSENCTNDAGCAGGEVCLSGYDKTFCATDGDTCAAGTTVVSADKAEGGTVQVCLAAATCNQGACN